MGCPNKDLLVRLVDGDLSEDQFAAIEAHVEGCGACQTALERLSDTTEAGEWRRHNEQNGRAVTIALPPPLEPGTIGRLDSFDVHEKLGGGAMGTVYRAHDTRLRRWVAIKVINPELAALPGFKKLFEREAHTAARVKSDHLVAIHHVSTGTADFPLPYLVMELVEGETLDRRLKRKGPMPPREAAGIALHVAMGLAAIHDAGLVHRDIKPANILLDRRSRRARIADFGLARAIDGVEERMALTAGTPGTPAYMSPEQFASPGEIDGRSDLFSLGVVLYQMLTGQQPFPGQSPEAIALRVTTASPVEPRAVNPKLPRDLETIDLVCLDKDADHRFQDAGALAEDLKRFLKHEPILSRRPPLGRRIVLFTRRNRALVRLAAFSLALLIFGGMGAWLLLSYERSRADQLAEGKLESDKAVITKTEEAERANQVAKSKTMLADEKAREAADRRRRELHTRYLVEIKDAFKAWSANAAHQARSLLDAQVPTANAEGPDQRGVEWYFLDYVLSAGHRNLEFGGIALAARLSPSGDRLAVLGIDTKERYCLRLWTLPDARQERALVLDASGPNRETGISNIPSFANLAGPQTVAFNGTGTLVAATCLTLNPGTREGIVMAWETATGKKVFEARDAGLSGQAVLFSRDDKSLIAGGYNNAALIWQMPGGALRSTIPGYEPGPGFRRTMARDIVRPEGTKGTHAEVNRILFDPSGRTLTISGHASFRLPWPPEQLADLPHEPLDSLIAYSPLGLWAVARDEQPTSVHLLRPRDDRAARTRESGPAEPATALIDLDQQEVQSVAVADDCLAIAPDGGPVTLVTVAPYEATVRDRTVLRGHKGNVRSLTLSTGARRHLAAVGHEALTVWPDVLDGPEKRLFRNSLANQPAAPSAGGADVKQHYSGGRWGYRVFDASNLAMPETPRAAIEIYELARPRPILARVDTEITSVSSAAISPDGSRLAVTGDDPYFNNLMRRAMREDRTRPPVPRPEDFAREIRIYVQDVRSGKTLHVMTGHRNAPIYMEFDRTGKKLVTASGMEPDFRLWDIESGRLLKSVHVKSGGVGNVAFVPDGRWVVTGGGKKPWVNVWDVASGESVLRIEGHKNRPVWALHGTLMAVPVKGRRIQVWDLERVSLVQEMNDLGQDIDAVAFLDRGRRLLSMGGQSLTLWTLETESEVFSIPRLHYQPEHLPFLAAALDGLKPAEPQRPR